MAEDDVRLEVEAVLSVYGNDCNLIQDFPPHLTVRIKPRTAEDSSQEFVEVTLGIKASSKYPDEAPYIYVTDMKGLDDGRQAHLIASIQKRAQELCSCCMLVVLCEEAVDLLTNMNYPEGDCPLCLYPLVSDAITNTSSFMKLMSCYHCFHSECMIRMWRWIQETNETQEMNKTLETTPIRTEVKSALELHSSLNQKGNCPVCRKAFDAKDIEHVDQYLVVNSSAMNRIEATEEEEKSVLLCDIERSRRQKFETILELQKRKGGLIEPTKNLLILPGMFLPETVQRPSTSAVEAMEQSKDLTSNPGSELNGSISSTTPSRNHNHNISDKRKGGSFKPCIRKQWIMKPTSSSKQ
ncbi:hypothetical protein HPP92_022132 [Vanilla planifolia]|uniref:RWD domain-containing protein n=1 Tax=Vanilla planifolia TaxID=51239 RepID=A0A835PQX2_VANPL|nr:hypothetical protein HPP92_022132 [Vanilla planifolia]